MECHFQFAAFEIGTVTSVSHYGVVDFEVPELPPLPGHGLPPAGHTVLFGQLVTFLLFLVEFLVDSCLALFCQIVD